jgi:hypothetical protein
MKVIEYSFKILDKRGNEIVGGTITESKYNEIINNKNITLKEEWGTKYEDSTLYGKKYKNEDGYTLFVWKEVFK